MSEWGKRKERRMWITPFFLVLSFRGWKMRVKKKKKKTEKNSGALMKWIGDDGGIECRLGNGELCPFACEGDYCAPLLAAPPRHPEIKTDKNISSHFRTSGSLTLISPPWAFFLSKHFLLSLPRFPSLLSSLVSSSFVCLPVHAALTGRFSEV